MAPGVTDTDWLATAIDGRTTAWSPASKAIDSRAIVIDTVVIAADGRAMTTNPAVMASYIIAICSDRGAIAIDRAVCDECRVVTDYEIIRNVTFTAAGPAFPLPAFVE